MTTTAVIVPTAMRPDNARDLCTAWQDTTAFDPHSRLILVADDDDPELARYYQVRDDFAWADLVVYKDSPHQIGPIINEIARRLLRGEMGLVPDWIGFMGDDHRPKTRSWNLAMTSAMNGRYGVVYGDDRNQGDRLPTACLISAQVIGCLGFMVPPVLGHLFLDDFWLWLGHATRLLYLPDVVIEHLHPTVGKAPVDAGYLAKGMNPAQFQKDGDAYHAWMSQNQAMLLDRLRIFREVPGAV